MDKSSSSMCMLLCSSYMIMIQIHSFRGSVWMWLVLFCNIMEDSVVTSGTCICVCLKPRCLSSSDMIMSAMQDGNYLFVEMNSLLNEILQEYQIGNFVVKESDQKFSQVEPDQSGVAKWHRKEERWCCRNNQKH